MVEGIYSFWIDTSDASVGAASNDVNMLVCTGGRQRSEQEFRALCKAAGFNLSSITPTPTRNSWASDGEGTVAVARRLQTVNGGFGSMTVQRGAYQRIKIPVRLSQDSWHTSERLGPWQFSANSGTEQMQQAACRQALMVYAFDTLHRDGLNLRTLLPLVEHRSPAAAPAEQVARALPAPGGGLR